MKDLKKLKEDEYKEAELVASMANREGWKILKKFIENNLTPIEKELNENFDLEKHEYNILQARRQELKKVLNFVEKRVSKFRNN